MGFKSLNHIYHLLEQYFSQDTKEAWSCASLVTRSGSSYRWPGAMMMISPWGKSFGLVSGGCLESDVIRRAQKVWQMGQSDYTVYDTADEESFAASLGLGCNGKIGILIQAISAKHHELLSTLYQRLQQKQASYLLQCYQSPIADYINHWVLLDEHGEVIMTTHAEVTSHLTSGLYPIKKQLPDKQKVQVVEDNHWAIAKITPPVQLWVLGGGLDAEPVVNIASTLGWIVTVVDHRVGYARATNFVNAKSILDLPPEQAAKHAGFDQVDAFICMTHNKIIDAEWMKQLADVPSAKYIGLLGPQSRKIEVMERAGLTDDFSYKVDGPAGTDNIRGDLPESIALSIITQCHCAVQR